MVSHLFVIFNTHHELYLVSFDPSCFYLSSNIYDAVKSGMVFSEIETGRISLETGEEWREIQVTDKDALLLDQE